MASNVKGITIEIDGNTSKLASALKDVNSKLRSTTSDLKKVNSALKLDPKSVNLLADKQKLLNEAISTTEDKLKTLKNAYDQNLSNPDVGEDEMHALRLEIDMCEASLSNYKTQLQSMNSDIDSSSMEDLADATDEASTSAQQLATDMNSVGDAAEKAADKAAEKFKKIGSTLQSAGSTMSKTVTAPILGIGTASVKTFADYESAMSQVQATMGITADATSELNGTTVNTMDALGNLAQEMGSTTAFSAKECAEALNYLALAGYDVQQMSDSLPTVLNLAAAGGFDLAKASDMVTDAMSALGIDTADAYIVVDQMAKAASSTNTSVEQLGDAMLGVAGTAKDMAGGTAELSTALGILANNSIKGSEGGTALRNVLLALEKPKSDKASAWFEELGINAWDAEGKLRPLNDILVDLNNSMEGMTDAEKNNALTAIFNKNDLNAVQALLAGAGEEWNNLQNEISNSGGSAQQMADTQLDNLNGQLTLLKSALEGAAISIGETLLPHITKLVDKLQGLVDWFNALSPATQETIIHMAGVAAAIGPVLSITGKLSSGIGGLISAGSKVSSWLGTLGNAASTTANTVGNAASTVSNAGNTISQVGTAAQGASQGMSAASGAMGALSQNALGFVAAGAGIALAAAGMWILAKAAVSIAEQGWGAAGALALLVAGIAGLAAIFAVLGPALTAGALGIGVFGAAVLGIGAGIGIASAGLALLCEQFPLVAEYGQPAAECFVALGAGILEMSTQCLAATPGLLAIDAALLALAVSTAGADVAWIAFAATTTMAAGSVAILDAAMYAFSATMEAVKDDATAAGDAIGFIQDNVDVIKSGVDGLKDAVANGLDGIVEFFKNNSTKPVDEWNQAFSGLYDNTVTQMQNVITVIAQAITDLHNLFASTVFQFGGVETPHFNMTGGNGGVPQVNVDWYATGGIFNSPQVIGVGDSQSPEAVVPIDKLQEMINVNSEASNGKILSIMSQMVTMMSQYMPQMANQQVVMDTGALVGQLTPSLDASLGRRADRRARQ